MLTLTCNIRCLLHITLQNHKTKMLQIMPQYAHDVVLKSVQRRFNVMDIVWTSKRRRVLSGANFFTVKSLYEDSQKVKKSLFKLFQNI